MTPPLAHEQRPDIPAGRKFARVDWAVLLLLLICGVVIALERWHTYDEPLERDLGFYAVVAHEINSGYPLYSYLWANQPPGIHLTYAIAEKIVGYGPQSIFFLNVVAGFLILVGIYFAASSVNRRAGIFAAIFWTIISGCPSAQANQPNIELFLNMFLIWGFALMNRFGGSAFSWRGIVGAGLCFAIATVYKQNIFFLIVFLCGGWLLIGRNWSQRIRALVAIGAIIGLTWLLIFVWLWVSGRLDAFRDSVIDYNLAWQNRNVLANFIYSLSLPIWPDGMLPLLLLGGVGTALAILKKTIRAEWFLLWAWACGVQTTIGITGRFFGHYYQLWLPILAISGAWGLVNLETFISAPIRRLLDCAVLIGLAATNLPAYRLPASEWSAQKYGGTFLMAYQRASEINRLLKPNETFYQFGNEPELYFVTRREPPTGILFNYPLQRGPRSSVLTEKVLRDLQQQKPDLLVVTDSALWKRNADSLVQWLHENYSEIPSRSRTSFQFFARQGSRLGQEQRLK